MTKQFQNRRWSVLWGFAGGLALLAKYSMLPFVGIAAGFGLVSALRCRASKNSSEASSVRLNYVIGIVLQLALAAPYYSLVPKYWRPAGRDEEPMALSEFLRGVWAHYRTAPSSPAGREGIDIVGPGVPEAVDVGSTMLCDLVTYPLLQVRSQLGWVFFLLLTAALLRLVVIVVRRGWSGVQSGESLLLVVLLGTYLFFSLALGLNNDVISGIAIPLMATLIAGFLFSLNSVSKYLLVGGVILNGLYFISPLHFDAPALRLDGFTELVGRLQCEDDGQLPNLFGRDAAYSIWNKHVPHYDRRESLLLFEPRSRPYEHVLEAQKASGNPYIYDLSAEDNTALFFYSALRRKTSTFEYAPCPQRFGPGPHPLHFRMPSDALILTSGRAYRGRGTVYLDELSSKGITECDQLLASLKTGESFEESSDYQVVKSPMDQTGLSLTVWERRNGGRRAGPLDRQTPDGK
jgi:hypothetical protein